MRLSNSGLLLVVTALAVGAGAERARAFSDQERFTLPSGAGGGGGRFFTGSPVDGYGCNVCHQGGTEPQVEVIGLPEEGYKPGRLYEIEVKWPNPELPLGLQLEFVGRDGRAAGQLLLIPPAQLDEGQRCMSGDREPADYENITPTRKVLGLAACGAKHMRFRFGPPDTPDVSFAMSVVRSDKGGTVDGDGTLVMRRVLRREGEPAPSTGNCAVASRRPGVPSAVPWLGLSLAALFGARRLRRR
jgi:hypothetical protein